MDDREKQHIQNNLRKLLELITPNGGFITEIEQTGILDSSELAHLESISSSYNKNRYLLDILKKKTTGYSILLNGVTQSKQSGAEEILRQLAQNQQQSLTSQTNNPVPAMSNNETHSNYRLVFGNEMNMGQILQRLKFGLVRCLPNKNSNISVILQLEALNLFDSDSIDPITNGQYQTELQRITALFEVIKGTGDRGILKCLEKLCDLKDQNVASQHIRETIEEMFPGSVQLRT